MNLIVSDTTTLIIFERYETSCKLVPAMEQGGVKTFLTEDLNHGQLIEDIRIENPFLTH